MGIEFQQESHLVRQICGRWPSPSWPWPPPSPSQNPNLVPLFPLELVGGNQLNRLIAAQQADYSSFPGGGGNQLNRLIRARQADYSSFPGGGNQLNRLIGARQADYSSFPGRDYQAENSNIAAYCPMCCVLVRICG